MTYELHPLCSFFPRITGIEFEKLKIDIGTNGQVHPIYLYQGMILDGGNRYRALMELGIAPKFVEYAGDNPVQFVLSSNLRRRHLTEGQAAAIVSAAQDWGKAHTRGGDRKSDRSATLHLDSAKDRAELAGVSLRTQKNADKLVKEAPPELIKEVTSGEKSLPKALKEIAPETEPAKTLNETAVRHKQDSQAPMSEVEALRDQVRELSDNLAEAIADNESMAKVFESDDKLKAALDESKRLRDVNRILEQRINGLMAEKAEAVREARRFKLRLDKAEKRISGLTGEAIPT